MIAGLEGRIVRKEPARIHLKVGGVVYEVLISLQTYTALSDEVYVHVTEMIREDAHLLYGFVTRPEQEMFEALTKINGIGGKAALAVCSTFSPERFAAVVAANDVGALKKVPGIGPKSAARMLVEISGFVVSQEAGSGSPAFAEAAMALESLGFKKEEVAKALSGIDAGEPTAVVVKEALKKLQKL